MDVGQAQTRRPRETGDVDAQAAEKTRLETKRKAREEAEAKEKPRKPPLPTIPRNVDANAENQPFAAPRLRRFAKQNAWAADLREKELDKWEAVALSERVKKAVELAKSKRRFVYNAEVERQKDLVRAEMEKRGDAVFLAKFEAATREVAAEMFANPSARDWIDSRRPVRLGAGDQRSATPYRDDRKRRET